MNLSFRDNSSTKGKKLMKLKNTITVKAVFDVLYESTMTYENKLNEPIQIANCHSSALFEGMAITDLRGQNLVYHSIPIDNGKGLLFAIELANPVAPGREFSFTLVCKASKQYFDVTTVQKENLFFWNLHHVPGAPCDLVQEIKFPKDLEIVHVIGLQPSDCTKNRALWSLSIPENHPFDSILVYKKTV
jgi:hypothetical protein